MSGIGLPTTVLAAVVAGFAVGASGGEAIVAAQAPLHLSVSVDSDVDVRRALLSLTVEPVVVDRSEAFLVRVLARTGPEAQPTEIGSFSFYPPPTQGQEQTFLLTLPPNMVPSRGRPVDILVEMIPARPSTPAKNSRIAIRKAVILSETR